MQPLSQAPDVVDNGAPTRVVVGEDQPIFRDGIVHVLEASGFNVLGATGDATDLVRKAHALSPDIVVADIQMPPNFAADGLEAARQIRAMEPAIAVLVLSHFLEDRYAIELLGERPEGVGYLLKDRVSDTDAFADAVRRVARGASVIDAEVVGRLVSRRRRHDPIDELTAREREVLGLMAQGRSNHGIAEVLVVTVSAVERHVTSVFSKFGLPQDAEDHRRVLAVLHYLQVDHPSDRLLPDTKGR